MSKFSDKLQRVCKTSPSPIGFRSTASESKSPAMLLIAGLSAPDAKEVELVANSEVDAGLILTQSFDIEDVKQTAKIMGDIPLGILIKDVSKEKVDKLVISGCDFVVFDITVPAIALQEEGIGKFLMIAPSLDQGLVRAVNNFEVDGIFVNKGEESFVTVEHLLIYQRFSELLNTPVIATLPSLVTSAELGNLWQTGINGIVIPPSQPIEAFAELRKIIADLPREARRLRGKVGVVLPHYGGDMTIEEEEEEEDI